MNTKYLTIKIAVYPSLAPIEEYTERVKTDKAILTKTPLFTHTEHIFSLPAPSNYGANLVDQLVKLINDYLYESAKRGIYDFAFPTEEQNP